MIRSLRHMLYRMKLSQRLSLANFLVITFIVTTLSLTVFTLVRHSLEKHNTFLARQAFQQAEGFLAYRLDNIISTSDALMNNIILNDVLNKDISTYSRQQQFVDMNSLRQTIYGYEDNQDIYRVHLYVDDSLLFANDETSIHTLSQAYNAFWWNELSAERGKIIFVRDWYPVTTPNASEPLISMLRIMYRQSDYSQVAFVLQLDLRLSQFEETLQSADFSGNSVTFLSDKSGLTIATSSQERQEELVLFDETPPVLDEPNTVLSIPWNRQRYISLQTALHSADWTMTTMIPYGDFMMDINHLLLFIVLFAIITLALSYWITWRIAGSQTRRIYTLCRHISRNANGALEEIPMDPYHDEISQLYQNYNQMITRIKQLIQENYEIGQELKGMEYRALQSQINPHFLYNTLDMINWLSFAGRSNELSRVVKSLAEFYRLSLGGGRYIVTVQDELHHAENYMAIQQIRQKNKVRFQSHVPADLLQYAIAKITLQPIIENALLHGILEKPDKSGEIVVSGSVTDDGFALEVSDNGVGFDYSQLPELQAMDQQDISDPAGGSHYGLANIDRRIKLLCGETWGLEIHSTPGQGTRVIIRLPRRHIDELEPNED